MSSWPPALVRLADSESRIRPAQVPQVGLRWTLDCFSVFYFLPSFELGFYGWNPGGINSLDEIAQGLEEVGSLCYEGDGGAFAAGDD
jgi:hypothetical protein